MFKPARLFMLALAVTALILLRQALTPQAALNLPYFRYPVVPGATISGYFDHDPRNGSITFYDGRKNAPGAGFYFSCTSPNMWDFVGCEDNVSGEANCPNSRELWYDNHHGIDYEFSPNWHTGATCDPGRFSGLTKEIYAPAAGRVLMAGTDPNRPANGWHIRLMHDVNGNGNYNDDNLRSIYLHFTPYALAVTAGQVVEEGQYLGLGGTSGYSSSPHLHFEVHRSSNNFQSYWQADPYGWQASSSDPWPYGSEVLWKDAPKPPTLTPTPTATPTATITPTVNLTPPGPNRAYVPLASSSQVSPTPTPEDRQLIQNGGFEEGRQVWVEQGVEIIASASNSKLPIPPYQGSWLGWLGGRNNAYDGLYQNVQVPSGYSKGILRYFVRVDTAESGGVYDVLRVNIKDAANNTVIVVETLNNTFSPSREWQQRAFALPDLTPWQGQTLRLVFEASTDSNAVTSFYIDEVSWVVSP